MFFFYLCNQPLRATVSKTMKCSQEGIDTIVWKFELIVKTCELYVLGRQSVCCQKDWWKSRRKDGEETAD